MAHHAGRALSRLAGVECDHWKPIRDTLQTTERLADRAFEVRHGGERFIVYMEAYTYWKDSALWNLLAENALLSERERKPTVSRIYILRPRGYRSLGGTFRLEVGGRPTQPSDSRKCVFGRSGHNPGGRDRPASWPFTPWFITPSRSARPSPTRLG